MAEETVTLEQAVVISEKLSPADRLRLISVLSEQLRGEIEQNVKSIDILSQVGLGAEMWQQIDVDAYLEEERASWDN